MPPRMECATKRVTLHAEKTPPPIPMPPLRAVFAATLDLLVWPRSALRWVLGNATAPRLRRIAAALRFGASRLTATLPYSADRPYSRISPVAPRLSQCVLHYVGTHGAKRSALPKRCLASLDLILPRVAAVLRFFVPSSLSPGLRQPGDGTPLRSDRHPSASALCRRSSLTPKTTTPQQRPLPHSATQIVRDDARRYRQSP